jgi:hypothetical protein
MIFDTGPHQCEFDGSRGLLRLEGDYVHQRAKSGQIADDLKLFSGGLKDSAKYRENIVRLA